MTRTPEEILAAFGRTAGLHAYDPHRSWRDVLFAGDGALTHPQDPDRVILASTAGELAEVERHVASVPTRLRQQWLEEVLNIPRQPLVPDRIVAHFSVDPALAPVALPPGVLLRGGKDAYGGQRRYRPEDSLTAHGASVVSTRTQVPRDRPGAVTEAGEFPLDAHAGADAEHSVRFTCDVLRFTGGEMTIRLGFTPPSVTPLPKLGWRYPRPDGTIAEAVGAITGSTVSVKLEQGCGVGHEEAWIEAFVPPNTSVPAAFSFSGVTIAVVSRTSLAPDAAYANDGLLDATKEFEPFGQVAKSGDTFYLRSDEAFSKPLASLDITMSVLGDGTVSPYVVSNSTTTLAATATSGPTTETPSASGGAPSTVIGDSLPATGWGAGAASDHAVFAENSHYPIFALSETQIQYVYFLAQAPRIQWERRTANGWISMTSAPKLGPLSLSESSGTAPSASSSEATSLPTSLSGMSGHFIRAFLHQSDFGWSSYQHRIAAFAGAAARGALADNEPMPLPPTPPIVSNLSLSYTTLPVPPTGIVARNGWIRRQRVGRSRVSFHPFQTTIDHEGHTGMVAIGLAIGPRSVGSSVSLHLAIDPARQCGLTGDPDARWEYWGDGGWQDLVVDDGTRFLRQSGVVRFVMPRDWIEGCDEIDARTGRWLRFVTRTPSSIGVIHHIAPDSVLASYISPDTATDVTPVVPLAAGEIKGTVARIPGVKKATNLAWETGRAPEGDSEFARRATGIVRHRGRASSLWDYEEHIVTAFPEVGAARCLPHTDESGARRPGHVGLVVVPAETESAPLPSVQLSAQIAEYFATRVACHARVVVLCPIYAPVSVDASLDLHRGVPSLTGRQAVEQALEAWLHPLGSTPTRWGTSLHRSALVAFLESLPVVDVVTSLSIRNSSGTQVDTIEVDSCRGLFCSSGNHHVDAREAL